MSATSARTGCVAFVRLKAAQSASSVAPSGEIANGALGHVYICCALRLIDGDETTVISPQIAYP